MAERAVLQDGDGVALGTTANPLIVNSNQRIARKAITYVAATTGAIATVDLFTVTGSVIARTFAICTTALESGGASTIEVGVTGATAIIIALTTSTSIIANEIWLDNSPTVIVDALPAYQIIPNGLDIKQKITDATITAGLLTYYCIWEPLSSGANVAA